MSKQSPKPVTQKSGGQPKIIADFGGRRKLLDRRSKRSSIAHEDRRTGKERRSGYDRRGALNQSDESTPDENKTLDRRSTPSSNS